MNTVAMERAKAESSGAGNQVDTASSQALRAAISTMRRTTSQVQRINDQLWEVWPDGRRKLLLR
ncbi:hypothetical protein [Pseudomonas oryzihabitans]|uniref:Uncharacterized protein n=1 Tax=Pseudomonas oryzihabitans TaxID=47885 RepID=A0AAJ2EZA9_9PSED|nr:hypothetical protein [Pseudomonas psychrotolerans]MDR6234195.1 hypothetical protein [Pseudomonas psychrotolerans]MDR6356695.1 hypothetical protein [Pseudomonas psychrotolerans]MDR6676647.1 hypothetical protein [Pseudomonas psychrotolerans]